MTALARLLVALALVVPLAGAEEAVILTPKPGPAPRINGARVFGVRPGSPFLFTIAATGERPIRFAAEGLPAGLRLDPATGRISGSVAVPGTHAVTLSATNRHGTAKRPFRIVGRRHARPDARTWAGTAGTSGRTTSPTRSCGRRPTRSSAAASPTTATST